VVTLDQVLKVINDQIAKDVLKMAGAKPGGTVYSAYELAICQLEIVANEIKILFARGEAAQPVERQVFRATWVTPNRCGRTAAALRQILEACDFQKYSKIEITVTCPDVLAQLEEENARFLGALEQAIEDLRTAYGSRDKIGAVERAREALNSGPPTGGGDAAASATVGSTPAPEIAFNREDHACSTGDCPHEKQSECDAHLARDFPDL